MVSAIVRKCLLCLVMLALAGTQAEEEVQPVLSQERVVFQLENGDVEFAFFPEVAPVTTKHIFTLVQLGLYTTNQIFRVDKGFVAQTSDVTSGRLLPLNEQQKELAYKNVPLEVKKGVKHHEGRLSMARGAAEDSGSSSIFFCYGDAPHLDMQYGIFGQVTRGMSVLHELEQLPTKREGIFVMPIKRVTILASYWYVLGRPAASLSLPGGAAGGLELSPNKEMLGGRGRGLRRAMVIGEDDGSGAGASICERQLADLKDRFASQAAELETLRGKMLP